MARGVPHPPELRARAVVDLLAGDSLSAVSRRYGVSRSRAAQWRRDAGNISGVGQEKREEFGELIANYLRETLTTLSVQARYFRTEAWLEKQPAGEAAILHGILHDKAVRVLTALRDATTPDDGQLA